jgi:hypothetical protein
MKYDVVLLETEIYAVYTFDNGDPPLGKRWAVDEWTLRGVEHICQDIATTIKGMRSAGADFNCGFKKDDAITTNMVHLVAGRIAELCGGKTFDPKKDLN